MIKKIRRCTILIIIHGLNFQGRWCGARAHMQYKNDRFAIFLWYESNCGYSENLMSEQFLIPW